MKKLMMLGLLLMIGLSFARTDPPPGPEYPNYVQTCCQYQMAYNFGTNAYSQPGYYVWNGQECVMASGYLSLYNPMDLYHMWWGEEARNGVYDYFWTMSDICNRAPASPECLTAKSQFNSAAKSLRGTVSTAYMGYLNAARQSISAYRSHPCGPGTQYISGNIRDAASLYRECIQVKCELH